VDRPSRARRRFHTDRIVANRRARYIREFGLDRFYIGDVEHHNDKLDLWIPKRLEYGRLADRDPWDCGHRCFLCHFEKLTGGGSRRARAKREWRKDWDVG
jgi:hypothetical protein